MWCVELLGTKAGSNLFAAALGTAFCPPVLCVAPAYSHSSDMGYNDLNLYPLQSLPLVPLSQTITLDSPSLAPSLARIYPQTVVLYVCTGSKRSFYL